MLQAHDLVNPSFNYLPRFNKPVLSYWIVAGFYKASGVSVATERVPIAIGGLLLVACAFVLGSLAGGGGSGPGNAGLWAAAGLAASPRLVMWARRIFIDIWISAFMALTLTFFALAERYPERRRTFLLLMYVSAGLGVLTKGPVAIVLPALAFGLYLVSRGELRRVSAMMLLPGIAIVAAIVVPWYLALYHQHGWTYIKSFLLTENLERYTEGTGVRQVRAWWFYVPVVLGDTFPWSLLLVPAAAIAWRLRDRTHALLWWWIATIVGFFSFSVAKQDLYVFPIVPAVAALGAAALVRAASDDGARRIVSWTLAVAGLLLVVTGVGVVYVFEAAGRVYALNGAIAIGTLAIAGGALAIVCSSSRRPLLAAGAIVAALVVADWTFVLRVLPDFERYKAVPHIAAALEPRLQPDDVVAGYQVAIPSLVYYLHRHVDDYFDEPSFLSAFRPDRRVFAVMSADNYAAVKPRLAGGSCVVARTPTFDVKLGNVLARQPPPELVVITNACGN